MKMKVTLIHHTILTMKNISGEPTQSSCYKIKPTSSVFSNNTRSSLRLPATRQRECSAAIMLDCSITVSQWTAISGTLWWSRSIAKSGRSSAVLRDHCPAFVAITSTVAMNGCYFLTSRLHPCIRKCIICFSCINVLCPHHSNSIFLQWNGTAVKFSSQYGILW